MARTESIIKGGFYEFPPQHLAPFAALFAPAQTPGRLIDPCAGEGVALQHFATAWNMEAYANELDHDRAAACVQKFGPVRAIQGDLYTLRTAYNAFQVAWVNPPYTWSVDSEEKRREFEMLQHAWKWVQVGGYVLWCVYQHHVSPRAAAWIAQRSQEVHVWGMPGKHLNEYDQVVVVCKVGKNAAPVQMMEAILQEATAPRPLTLTTEPLYRFPEPQRIRHFVFCPKEMTPEIMLASIQAKSAHQTATFKQMITPPPPITQTNPAVPPRGGQRILTLAAGFYNGMTLLTPDRGKVAVRSTLTPVEHLKSTEFEVNEQGDTITRETYKIRPDIKITLLSEGGEVVTFDGEDAMADFISRYMAELKAYLETNFHPIYDPQNPELDVDTLKRLARLRLRKGSTAYALFKPQKHVVAAVDRVLRVRRDRYGQGSCYLVGEPGTGKTFMGGALIDLIQLRRAEVQPGEVILIMCPPHLVKKWKRELHGVDARHHAEILERVPEVTKFMSRARKFPQQLHIGIISREMAKLGEGIAVSVHWQNQRHVLWQHGTPRPADVPEEEARIVTTRIPHCPRCSEIVMKDEETLADEDYFYSYSGGKKRAKKRTCKSCGSPLWQYARTFSKPKAGQKSPAKCYRMPLAEFIATRYAGRVYMSFYDELHEVKESSTDQGRAFSALAHISKYIVGLTGTIYSGKASSLFWLEWLFNPRVRQQYTWDAAGRDRWVANMGVLERVEEDRPQYDGETGAYSGHSRFVHKPAEAPGVSPMLVREILDHAVFIGLKDMGVENLPMYRDIPVAVQMEADHQQLYAKMRDELGQYLMQCQRDGDATFRGAYLNAMLCQPNAPHRGEVIIHRRRLPKMEQALEIPVMTIPSLGVDRIYPKEQMLIDLIATNLAEGRGVGIFVRQTNTRDIQPRLNELVRKAIRQVQTYILYSSEVEAKHREEELERQVNSGVKVFFTNPKCVETGLDLLEFPTLIFYEPSYSLSLTRQASGRAWRLPQKKDCRTYHLYYENTMEARAVRLVAEKARAANLLTGESETGLDALLGDAGDDVMTALTRSWDESDQVDVSDIEAAFAEADPKGYDLTQSIWYTAEDIFAPYELTDDERVSGAELEEMSIENGQPLIGAEQTADPLVQTALDLGAVIKHEGTEDPLPSEPPRVPRRKLPPRQPMSVATPPTANPIKVKPVPPGRKKTNLLDAPTDAPAVAAVPVSRSSPPACTSAVPEGKAHQLSLFG